MEYSGSTVSFGNMYCLPPPKITYNKIIIILLIIKRDFTSETVVSDLLSIVQCCARFISLGPYINISIMDELVRDVLAATCDGFRGQLFIAVPASFRGVGVTGSR